MPSFFGSKPVEHPVCKASVEEVVKMYRKCSCCGREIILGLPEHDLFRCVSHLKDRIEILEKEKFNVGAWVETLTDSIRVMQNRLEAVTKKSSPAGNKQGK